MDTQESPDSVHTAFQKWAERRTPPLSFKLNPDLTNGDFLDARTNLAFQAFLSRQAEIDILRAEIISRDATIFGLQEQLVRFSLKVQAMILRTVPVAWQFRKPAESLTWQFLSKQEFENINGIEGYERRELFLSPFAKKQEFDAHGNPLPEVVPVPTVITPQVQAESHTWLQNFLGE